MATFSSLILKTDHLLITGTITLYGFFSLFDWFMNFIINLTSCKGGGGHGTFQDILRNVFFCFAVQEIKPNTCAHWISTLTELYPQPKETVSMFKKTSKLVKVVTLKWEMWKFEDFIKENHQKTHTHIQPPTNPKYLVVTSGGLVCCSKRPHGRNPRSASRLCWSA